MRKNIFIMLIMTMILSFANKVSAEDAPRVILNDMQIDFPDVKPFINENNRTLVPVRFIAESLGAVVTWDDESQTVQIQKENVEIKLTIGSIFASYKTLGEGTSTTSVELDAKPILKDGRVLVPFRFVSEILGQQVIWDSESNTIIMAYNIDTPKYPKNIYMKPLTKAIEYIGFKEIEPNTILQNNKRIEKLTKVNNLSSITYMPKMSPYGSIDSLRFLYVEGCYNASGETYFNSAIWLDIYINNSISFEITFNRNTPTNYKRLTEIVYILADSNEDLKNTILDKVNQATTNTDKTSKVPDMITLKDNTTLIIKNDKVVVINQIPKDERINLNIRH